MASVDEQPTVPPIAPTSKSQEDRDDLAAIDRAIDRMRAFTPADPYVLTIPQDVEPRYHHSYLYQSKQWLHNTPFQPREHESTQYQTFVYHEPGKEMYMLHNSRHGEAEKGEEKNGLRTGANTPNAQPKKTISLTAYKQKQAALTPEQGLAKESEAAAKKPAVKGPLERVKADEEVLAVLEGDRELQDSPPKEEKKDLKRKRDDASEKEGKTERTGGTAHVEEEGRAKKAQRSTPPSSTTDQLRNTTKKIDEKQPHSPNQDSSRSHPPKPAPAKPTMEFTLPPKLSPPRSAPSESKADPATKSPPSAVPKLPSRLSSSMSDLMKQILSARTPRSASKDGAAQHRTPPSKNIPRNAFRASSNKAAHGAEESSEDASGDPKAEKVSRRTDHSKRSPLGAVVKLKFKSQGEKVKQMLKKPPRPSKLSDEEVQETAKRPRPDSQADKNAPRIKSSTIAKDDVDRDSAKRKRSHAEEDDAPPKRKKTSPNRAEARKRDEPSTPVPSDQISPPSARFPITPGGLRKGKDLLSTSMKRDNSNDSRINTPPPMSHSSPSINGTPAATSSNKQQPDQSTTNGAPKHLTPSVKTPKQQAFEAEQIRLEKLGKELKHAATAHLKPPPSTSQQPQPPTARDQKLAAIKSLESLLSYLLAFTCADAAALSADPKLAPSPRPWKSLHGFLGFVKAHCEPFPALQGVACWLGVVFHSRVLELAARGGVGSLSREGVLDSVAAMGKAGRAAEGKLDFDVLRQKFPKAWEGRSREVGVVGAGGEEELEIASPAGAEGGKSGKVAFAGPYKLPLGAQSSPLRAARAGYAMLEEWIEGHGGESLYALKLKL